MYVCVCVCVCTYVYACGGCLRGGKCVLVPYTLNWELKVLSIYGCVCTCVCV